ncbi:hypothetical protein EAF04_009710 [Stromatinia cepivora]|nr:hypothetical protein EAF04_009710 [Stromatinia cepivora]
MWTARTPHIEYATLPSGESNTSVDQLQERVISQVKRHAFWKAFLIIETLHLCLLLLGYGIFSTGRLLFPQDELNTYFALSDYSTVKTFVGNAELMNRSALSDQFLAQIQTTDGVVAIDTEWALRHNYAPSVAHPDDPTKSIYQIDMFHSIHCVYRLRNLLTSSLSLEEWPRNDEHTLHCLDYMREQLMCNSDLLLQATDDLILFKKNNGHVCRDSDAIMTWAIAHHWEDHRRYLKDTVGFE